MPELPEVETITKQLLKSIKGKTIKKIDVFLPKMVRSDLKQFKKLLIGAKISNIKRRAKLVIIELDNGYNLVIHLKLNGQLIVNGPKLKYTHFIYHFTDKSHLVHNDVRQFGYVKIVSTDKLTDFFKKENFGPEPLQRLFTLNVLQKKLARKPKSKIKLFLLDQKNIAGLGNIYTDEILFFAGVRPTRLVRDLKLKEIEKIYKGIKLILKQAIQHKGTSAAWYLDTQGRKGNFQNILKMYQKKDKPCPACRTKVQRIKMGSRSAHFCPNCQK